MSPASRLTNLARRSALCINSSTFATDGPATSLLFTTATSLRAAVPEAALDEALHEKLPHIPLNFNDARAAFKSKRNSDIIRTWSVLSACQIQPLVDNADSLLAWSRRVLGSWLVNGVIKQTFFKHFCAGENQKEIQPSLALLKQYGIGAILDYAAEDDVKAEDGPVSRSEPHDTVVARTFDYESEAKCQQHTSTFLKNIQAAGDAPGQGFAAIKVTALGNPKLLERVSNALLALRDLFKQFDADSNNIVTREEFAQVYETLFTDASPARIKQIFNRLDRKNTGFVDYLEWSKQISLGDVPRIVKNCREPGPLSHSSLTDNEYALLNRMMQRLDDLADAAARLNVKLMVDAEHSYFQPAIDHAVTELQRKHNKKQAVIYNTYQCYLKDSEARLVMDLDRAQREGFFFGAKLVRGAYMHLERQRAQEKRYPSPIWDTIEETHANYNRCVRMVVERVKSEGAEVMVASHNQHSVETAVAQMHELDMDPSACGVFFGQLLGMADPLSFVLGRSGYRAYKYVPWGRIEEVIPYLVRRAQENSTVLAGIQKEKAMLLAELWRRLRQDSFPMRLLNQARSQPSDMIEPTCKATCRVEPHIISCSIGRAALI